MNEKFPMTAEGLKMLRNELENLKNFERPNIIKAIAEAREHGDLSENAEYHAAREKQSFIEGRIVELENKVTRAEVIDPTKLDDSKVTFGATVVVTDLVSNSKKKYKIVGADEADIEKNLISVSAPLCKAMINKKVDDVFEVQTPNGIKEFQINSIDFYLVMPSKEKILIIGSGPAGYTAAIYAARAGLKPLLISGLEPGGQLTITTDVENFPGFENPIQGPWLMEQMKKQAEIYGTRILIDYVKNVDFSEKVHKVITEKEEFESFSTIIASNWC